MLLLQGLIYALIIVPNLVGVLSLCVSSILVYGVQQAIKSFHAVSQNIELWHFDNIFGVKNEFL